MDSSQVCNVSLVAPLPTLTRQLVEGLRGVRLFCPLCAAMEPQKARQ